MWSSLFNTFKLKRLIAINNDINIKKTDFLKLRRNFISKIRKIIYLFAFQNHDGKYLNIFLTK